jgi:hypothetical protein
MKTSTENTGLAIKTSIKAGALTSKHNRSGLKVRSAINAGALTRRPDLAAA